MAPRNPMACPRCAEIQETIEAHIDRDHPGDEALIVSSKTARKGMALLFVVGALFGAWIAFVLR